MSQLDKEPSDRSTLGAEPNSGATATHPNPLHAIFLRFSTTRTNQDPPPAITDCQPFVSRLQVGGTCEGLVADAKTIGNIRAVLC